MKKKQFSNILLVTVGLFLLFGIMHNEADTGSRIGETNDNHFSNVSTTPAKATLGQQVQRQQPLPPTPEEQARARTGIIEAIVKALNTPIAFYGRVVDQSNQPVAGATIYFNAADKFDAPGSLYQKTSDENGLFSISGIHGADLSVGAAKDGYYSRELSGGIYNYGNGPHGKNRTPPTKENPAVFVLVKAGATEPIIHVERDVSIPKDGTSIEVNLATGRIVPAGNGNFQIQCWTHDEAKIPNHRLEYSWKCRVSVPGGGLQCRTNEFEFQAPSEGYVPADEMGMPQTGMRWSDKIKRNYFVMLADGRFARIQFEMIAGGKHFAYIETFLNPTPGHRNLEFDSKKVIEVTK